MGDDSDIFLDVAPKKGRALLWPSMLNEDLLALDVRTYHEALEVKKGVKYGANVWMHLRDFKNYDICDEEAAEGGEQESIAKLATVGHARHVKSFPAEGEEKKATGTGTGGTWANLR